MRNKEHVRPIADGFVWCKQNASQDHTALHKQQKKSVASSSAHEDFPRAARPEKAMGLMTQTLKDKSADVAKAVSRVAFLGQLLA